MADVPKDLLSEIKALEDAFTIDTAKVKAISKHFVTELEKGLTVEGGSIVRKSPMSLRLRASVLT